MLALACFQVLLAGMVGAQWPKQLYKVQSMFNLETTVAFKNSWNKTIHFLNHTHTHTHTQMEFNCKGINVLSQGRNLHRHTAINVDISSAVYSRAAHHADGGYIWYVAFPWCTHMRYSELEAEEVALTDWQASSALLGHEPGSLALRGESWGEMRRHCGREYS